MINNFIIVVLLIFKDHFFISLDKKKPLFHYKLLILLIFVENKTHVFNIISIRKLILDFKKWPLQKKNLRLALIITMLKMDSILKKMKFDHYNIK